MESKKKQAVTTQRVERFVKRNPIISDLYDHKLNVEPLNSDFSTCKMSNKPTRLANNGNNRVRGWFARVWSGIRKFT